MARVVIASGLRSGDRIALRDGIYRAREWGGALAAIARGTGGTTRDVRGMAGLAVDFRRLRQTQFEVADTRRMFPVFEQPDLKSRFAFTVTAPAHWKVVSNSSTPAPEPTSGGSVYAFAPTPRMSTYITAIVAGDYHGVTDWYKGEFDIYPLGLYCRKSMAEFLDVDAARRAIDIQRRLKRTMRRAHARD